MSAEPFLLTLVGFLAGIAVGVWRTMVYARKLTHFNVNLDKWAHYDEHTRQAKRKGVFQPASFGTDDD